MKLNFGCGSNHLEGWKNMDIDVRIDRPLPFTNASASFILAEHVTEHVSPQEAWNFLSECHRVLQPGGIVRVCVPDIARIWKLANENYRRAAMAQTNADCVYAAIFKHGHQGAYTAELLEVVMQSIGFATERCSYGESRHVELHGVDGHGKVVSDEVARIETSVVEGTK